MARPFDVRSSAGQRTVSGIVGRSDSGKDVGRA